MRKLNIIFLVFLLTFLFSCKFNDKTIITEEQEKEDSEIVEEKEEVIQHQEENEENSGLDKNEEETQEAKNTVTFSYYINNELYFQETHDALVTVELINLSSEYSYFKGWYTEYDNTRYYKRLSTNADIKLYFATIPEIANVSYLKYHLFNVGDVIEIEFEFLLDESMYRKEVEVINRGRETLVVLENGNVLVNDRAGNYQYITVKIYDNNDKLIRTYGGYKILLVNGSVIYPFGPFHLIEGIQYFKNKDIVVGDVISLHLLEELPEGYTYFIRGKEMGVHDFRVTEAGEFGFQVIVYNEDELIVGASDVVSFVVQEQDRYDGTEYHFLGDVSIKDGESHYFLDDGREVGTAFKNGDIIIPSLCYFKDGQRIDASDKIFDVSYKVIHNGNNYDIKIVDGMIIADEEYLTDVVIEVTIEYIYNNGTCRITRQIGHDRNYHGIGYM